jgi:hypothetical protein
MTAEELSKQSECGDIDVNLFERDKDWILAMADALGMQSGFNVPIVPEPEPFRKLFAEIRAPSVANAAMKWPNDYEAGFEHALAIAKMHSGLPGALAAMQRELETDGVTPSKSECPYCGDEIHNGLHPVRQRDATSVTHNPSNELAE